MTEHERLGALVDENSAALRAIENVAETRVKQRRWASAVAWSRIGAVFAMANPTTSFRSFRIERVLDEVSRRLLPPAPSARRSSDDHRAVLHVVSEGPVTGGHIRFATRWADVDERSSSTFVTTRPGKEVPMLSEVASRHSGHANVLSGSSVDRAAQLRQMTAEFDVIVCHPHSDDVIPCLAFGGDYRGAPVILMNHADHVFNLGAGNIAIIASMRRTGVDFAVEVRGYPELNSYLLPIPMHGVNRVSSREAAKHVLGIPPHRVVALTLARPSKYPRSPTQPGFVDVVAPALANSDTILVAVGPSPDEVPWTEAASVLGDRLRVEGMQADPQVYLDAADIYLDSIPFASATSMLEAACRGTPILAYRPHNGFQRLHSSEGILDGAALTGRSQAEYRAALALLVSDESYRRRHGAKAAEAVLARHGDVAWTQTLEGLYSQAASVAPSTERVPESIGSVEEIREYAAELAGIESLTPLLGPIMGAIRGDHEPLFDSRDRNAALVRTGAARILTRVRGGGLCGPERAELLVPGMRRLSRI